MAHEKLCLKDPEIPIKETLQRVLGGSYGAYERLQKALPNLELEQEWQWYTPHKAWYARGQYKWTTPRGTNKEKTIYWLYVFDGYFNIAVWFLEKNRAEILGSNVSDNTKKLIRDSKTFGKLQTFPVTIDVRTIEALADISILIRYKQKLETY